jgi:histidinol phosphatase-like enzyme (inositol monophosphatase family)
VPALASKLCFASHQKIYSAPVTLFYLAQFTFSEAQMTQMIGDISVDTLTKFACELADAAAEVTLKYFRAQVGVDNKLSGDDFDPVTEGDQGAERAIRALLEKRFPKHDIFGEEYGRTDKGSDYEWVLDPIDGTRAFISGLPTWGTLIALTYKGEPVIGVIDQPYIKERYLGWPGGASLNGTPMRTRTCSDLASATLSTTDPDLFIGEDRAAFDRVLAASRLIRYGMDCYAYAIVASGHMDLVVEAGLNPYDMMALIPVIRGAGGIATNWKGDAPGPCGRLIACGDAALHKQVLGLLQD